MDSCLPPRISKTGHGNDKDKTLRLRSQLRTISYDGQAGNNRDCRVTTLLAMTLLELVDEDGVGDAVGWLVVF